MTLGEKWEQPNTAHLTDLEKRYAAKWFRIDPDTINGPPTGLLIGEMPGPATTNNLPLFPYPSNSAGGRLLKISKLEVGTYLGRLKRFNLFSTYLEGWQPIQAVENASKIFAEQPEGFRVLCLGQRVAQACGLGGWFDKKTHEGVEYVAIPHPSGKNQMYNNPATRAGARMAIQWAADTQVVLEIE